MKGYNYFYLIRRLVSFVTDVTIVNIVYILVLLLLNTLFEHNQIIQQAVKSYYSISVSSSASISNTVLIEIGITFFILYGIYFFLMLLAWNKTLGMFLTGVNIVKSDKDGNPEQITTLQKFSRGFFCGILSFFFIFTLPLPFDTYHRSIADYIAETYVVADQVGLKRRIYIWCIFIITLALLFTASFG